MPKFSANLGFLWIELPLLERIKAASRAGFKAVELHGPYDVPAAETKATCAQAGVKLLGINTDIGAGPNGHKGYGAVPGMEAAFQGLVTQSIDYVAEAGGTSVHAMAGLVPEADYAKGFETLVANLKWAATRAAEKGIVLLLEPLNPHDMKGYFYSRVEQAADVIDAVGASNVKLMFDAYHVGRAQGDILTRLRAYYAKIGHVQIAAVPSRAEPDEGEIAFPAFFKALEELGYDGWIGAEYRPRASTDAGLSWTKALGVTL